MLVEPCTRSITATSFHAIGGSHLDSMAHPAMGSIPLECILCPKHPKFSDISHLLTHVASKGHLSNQFKLKVRASTDEAARKLVEDFDNWYLIWNVDMLMHNRLNLKDKKRPRTKPVGQQARFVRW